MNTSFLVFTCNYGDDSADRCRLLRESCAANDVPLAIYGEGKPWPGYVQAKIIDALEFLKGRTEEVVLYTDGHDSFLSPSLRMDALMTQLDDDAAVVVSSETNCWPDADRDKDYKEQMPHPLRPWQYVNAGGWVGPRVWVMEALAWMLEHNDNRGDDQRLWTYWWLTNGNAPTKILDTYCITFQALGGLDPIDWPVGRNMVTNTFPLVFHFNGRTPGMQEKYDVLWGKK